MVSSECCTKELLQGDMKSGRGGLTLQSFSCTASKKVPRGNRKGFRTLMKACWTQAPLERSRCGTGAPLAESVVALSSASPLCSLPDDVLMECLARLPLPELQNSFLVCQRWRTVMQTPQFYQLRQIAGKLESLLVVFGGYGNEVPCVVYNPGARGWTPAPLFPPVLPIVQSNVSDVPLSFLHAQPVTVQHRIFVIGAMPVPNCGEDCTLIYDMWANTLTRKAPMLCSRKKFACCVIGNRILVAGGTNRRDPNRDPIMNAEEYIPEEDIWRPLACMPRKRYGCLGIAVNDVFYVVGGLNSRSMTGMCTHPFTYVSSMDSFDIKTNTWQKTKPLPIGGCVIACSAVGSCIYMLSSHAVELSFWKYDTQKDAWSRIKSPPFPSPLRMDNRLKFSCITLGSLVYVIQIGGSIDDLLRRSGRHARGMKEGLVLIYDTILQAWSRGPNFPCLKNGVGCTIVQC